MKGESVYLLHIRDAIKRILDYTASGRESFFNETKSQDAVLRNLEIVGEAAKNLPETFKQEHSGIPWKRLAGMRDKLIHDYFGVNLRIVWDVIQRDLPELQRKINEILAKH